MSCSTEGNKEASLLCAEGLATENRTGLWVGRESVIPVSTNHMLARVYPYDCISRAGEMAQYLRALTALPEDQGSIPSTHMEGHNSV